MSLQPRVLPLKVDHALNFGDFDLSMKGLASCKKLGMWKNCWISSMTCKRLVSHVWNSWEEKKTTRKIGGFVIYYGRPNGWVCEGAKQHARSWNITSQIERKASRPSFYHEYRFHMHNELKGLLFFYYLYLLSINSQNILTKIMACIASSNLKLTIHFSS
jgi:hypothetical protein